MLVLSRHRDETIMVGDDVEITVVDIRVDKVRLGITAPTRIAVHRKEIYEAIQRENRQASRLTDQDATSLATSFTAIPENQNGHSKPTLCTAGAITPLRCAAVGISKRNGTTCVARPTATRTHGVRAGRAG